MATKLRKSTSERTASRVRRRARVRKRVRGVSDCPRLCVFKSLRFTYAQLIADDEGKVIVGLSSRGLLDDGASEKSTASAKLLGGKIAEFAKGNGISRVVFDRNGSGYHGRIAAVAEGAREAGLKF